MAEPQKATTLAELSGDIFLLVLGFRERANSIDYNTLYQGVLTLFEELDKKAKALKFDSEDIVNSRYALAAFVDEAILRSQWTGREQWADNPLQLQLFETYLAGEGFFERLENLRARGESAADVLEIYYLCLALGFEGKYGIEGTERLSALSKSLHDELSRFRPIVTEGISPHWKVVDGPVQESNKLPRWLIYSCAAVIIACVLLYIGFFISIRSSAGDLQNNQGAAILMQVGKLDRLILC
jgi:type VI secretion system protein ImpK